MNPIGLTDMIPSPASVVYKSWRQDRIHVKEGGWIAFASKLYSKSLRDLLDWCNNSLMRSLQKRILPGLNACSTVS
jgi:hypothetical protein